MASNARPGGSPNAPAGQPASGEVTGEAGVDAAATAASQVDGPGRTVVVNVGGSDAAGGPDDDTYPTDITVLAGTPSGWPAPPPAVRADGWDADSTATWDPASAWAAEDAVGPDSADGSWDEVPDWEGEIVKWESPEGVAGPLALIDGAQADGTGADWSGARRPPRVSHPSTCRPTSAPGTNW